MEYNIIADAGSTKVDWAVVGNDGNELSRLTTTGLNALLANKEDVDKMLLKVRESLPSDAVGNVFYYGAGCATPEICDKISDSIRRTLSPSGEVAVTTDLLAAARATLGHDRGIACILGTGSNSCLYDGEKIELNIPSLGFILGDEGSGAALGKRLVTDAFKGHLPEIVKEKFLDTYRLSLSDILEQVYRRPSANRFLASLVPFLKENIWNPYVYSLVLREFTEFFGRNVSRYPGVHQLPITITGSLGYHFEKIVREAAGSHGFTVSSIVRSPLDGLISFHSKPA